MKEGKFLAKHVRIGTGPHDYAGVHECAQHLGVSKQTFVNWRSRYPDGFPEQVASLKMGPIYQLHEIQAWAKRHGLAQGDDQL